MVCAIVVASGFSKRMGRNKLLLPFRGKPLIENVLECVSHCFDSRIVVTNTDGVKELSEKHGFLTVHNDNPEIGQSNSIVLGVKNAPLDCSYMFFVGDQPFLTESFIQDMLEFHSDNPGRIVIPKCGEKKGNPVIFPNSVRASLLSVEGDAGGRQIVEKHKELAVYFSDFDPVVIEDIDTMEQYDRYNSSL